MPYQLRWHGRVEVELLGQAHGAAACEELKLITHGSILAADNVIQPGNPPYLEYVRSSVSQKKTTTKTANSVNGVDRRFADRTAKQYLQREGESKLDEGRKGDPLLVYESQLVHSFEPSGIAVRAGFFFPHSQH